MPQLAARTIAQGRRADDSSRRRRVLLAAACAVVASTSALAPVRAQAATDRPVVLLPGDAARSLEASAGGWSATTQVTATGCGPGGCPAATATWRASVGTGGGADGALEASIGAAGSHSGVASVTWRSPLFLVPNRPTAVSFTVALRADHTWSPSVATGLTYAVRVLGAADGTVRTIADGRALPEPAAGWTTTAPALVPPAFLPASSLVRLELELHVPITPQSTGGALVWIDDPTLAITQAAVETGEPAGAPEPDAGASWPVAAGIVAGEPSPTELPLGSQLVGCGDDAVEVFGASALGRRIAVAGGTTEVAGTSVQLLSDDGWTLARTAVGADGLFTASFREPRGSQGIDRVFARLPDGDRSPSVRVERRNVLRSVRRVGDRIVVDGTLARGAASGALRAEVEVPADAPCAPPRLVRASGFRFDRLTGRYRASTDAANLAPGVEPLVRTRVTMEGGDAAPRVLRSQLRFGAARAARRR